MKIVIFIDWFAPAYKAGGPIQSIVNLVNQPLEGAEYRIICSNKDLDGSPLQDIRPNTWVRFNERTEVWYISNDKTILSLLKKIAFWKPDIFFINGVYSFYYNFLPIAFGTAAKKIISARGMLHAGALSQKGLKKKVYLAVWNLLGVHRRNFFHATTAEEKNFIEDVFGPKTKVLVAQNFPKIFQPASFPKKISGSLYLISIGLVSPMKNYLEVIRALKNCSDKIYYTIYGPVKDKQYWQKCKEELKTLPPNVEVRYEGDIPAGKIEATLAEAHVFVLPSKSENFGHAIYEALTAGKPVITSHNTPWNNLQDSAAGINISVGNDYELSKAICFFAKMDGVEFRSWSKGARTYSEKAIDINIIKNQYLQMFFGMGQEELPYSTSSKSVLKT